MHGGEMGAGDAALQPQALGLVGEALDVPREGIVALVAVHVHQQAAPGGDFAELPHRFRAVCHGALEMRDAAHHVDPRSEEHTSELQSLLRNSYAVYSFETKKHMCSTNYN